MHHPLRRLEQQIQVVVVVVSQMGRLVQVRLVDQEL
jgi:hypothetical protein